MCVHVVYAHPSPDSFTAAVHRHIVEGLAARGAIKPTISTSMQSTSSPYTLAEREGPYAVGATRAGVVRCGERLSAAEALVLCFPTWWYEMPAILEGRFDRIRPPGVTSTIHLRAARSGVVLPVSASSWLRPDKWPRWLMLLYMQDPGRTLMCGFARLIASGDRTHYHLAPTTCSALPRVAASAP